MFSFIHSLTINPMTGDQSDLGLTIGLIVGGVCVLAVVAMLIIPKLSRKKTSDEEPQVEEITED